MVSRCHGVWFADGDVFLVGECGVTIITSEEDVEIRCNLDAGFLIPERFRVARKFSCARGQLCKVSPLGLIDRDSSTCKLLMWHTTP